MPTGRSIECEFKEVGCSEKVKREDSEEHMREKAQTHLSMMAAASVKMWQEFQTKLQEQERRFEEFQKKLQEHERNFGENKRLRQKATSVESHPAYEQEFHTKFAGKFEKSLAQEQNMQELERKLEKRFMEMMKELETEFKEKLKTQEVKFEEQKIQFKAYKQSTEKI